LFGQRFESYIESRADKEESKLLRLPNGEVSKIVFVALGQFRVLLLHKLFGFAQLLLRLLHRFFGALSHFLVYFWFPDKRVFALGQCSVDRLMSAASNIFDRDVSPGGSFAQESLQLADAVNSTAVEAHDHVVFLQACLLGGTALDDLHHDRTSLLAQR